MKPGDGAASLDRPATPILLDLLPPFLLAAAATAACRLAAGPGLGLFFGGIVAVALLAPPLSLVGGSLYRRAVSALAVSLGVGAIWFIAGVAGPGGLASAGQWLRCAAVVLAFALALAGLAALLAAPALRLGRSGAAAGVVALALAWLAWPVWLAPQVTGARGGAIVDWLAPPHPLLAVNGVLQEQFGAWHLDAQLAYRYLTNLQHVPYAPPQSVTAAVVAHAFIAFATFALAIAVGGARPSRDAVRARNA